MVYFLILFNHARANAFLKSALAYFFLSARIIKINIFNHETLKIQACIRRGDQIKV